MSKGLAICGGLVLCVISGGRFMYRVVRGQHPFDSTRTLSPKATNTFRVIAAATLGAGAIAVVPTNAVPEPVQANYKQVQGVVREAGTVIGCASLFGAAWVGASLSNDR